MNKELIKQAVVWDVVNWSKALGFWERHLPDTLKGMNTLELGGGDNGGISLWLAAKGADVLCSGYSGVNDSAKHSHSKFGLDNKIKYSAIDALNIPFENEFDIICFKSMLGGIVRGAGSGAASSVMEQIHKALKPGGVLIFAENLSATRLHSMLRNNFGAGKNKWYYFTIEEISSLAEDKFNKECKTFGVAGLFGFSESMRRFLGTIDTLLFEKISPQSAHYIYTGVWRKR